MIVSTGVLYLLTIFDQINEHVYQKLLIKQTCCYIGNSFDISTTFCVQSIEFMSQVMRLHISPDKYVRTFTR